MYLLNICKKTPISNLVNKANLVHNLFLVYLFINLYTFVRKLRILSNGLKTVH
jgi:hypothetical protein